MIVVTGNVTRVASMYLVRSVGEAIPDTLTLAVLVPRTFNLVCRGAGAPGEAGRECEMVIGNRARWFDITCYNNIERSRNRIDYCRKREDSAGMSPVSRQTKGAR